MPSILIIDDDADLSAIVGRFLESEGFAVVRVGSAEDAYEVLRTRSFDLVLLDINLPGDDGFAACAALRRTSGVPLIFASARTSETDRIVGLDTGGDDYLPKPYSLRELLAHVNALLRRSQGRAGSAGGMLAAGPFSLDEGAGTLAKHGENVPLSPKELALALSEVEPQTVSVHMSWLRVKLEDDPSRPAYFKTVRGRGYRFDASGEPS